MSEQSRSWSWRHAIIKSDLSATTRHVLLTISCFMNDIGGGCYPTTKQLSEATGLSERAICTHIQKAADAGWLTVSEHGFKGQKWRNHEYKAAWPDQEKALNEVQQLNGKGTELGSVRKCEGTEPNDKKVLNEVQSNSPYTNPSLADAREAPPVDNLTQRLVEAVGGEEKIQAIGALNVGPIYGLLQAGADLEVDILPTLRAVSNRMKRPAGTWNYFVPAIREAMDARLAAGQLLQKPIEPKDEPRWRKILGFARQQRVWDSKRLGPPPGEAGCLVPRHLLEPSDGQGWSEYVEAA